MSTEKVKDVGVVCGLSVYPVKSMAGMSIEDAAVGFAGLAYDREYAFLREQEASGLPWASARQFPFLLTYQARVHGIGERRGSVVVTSPEGSEMQVDDPKLASELSDLAGEPLRLVKLYRRAYDSAAADVSLITQQSIDAVSTAVGRELEPSRFRANLLIQSAVHTAFREEKWVGASLMIGSSRDPLRLKVTRKDPRCKIVSLDPVTGTEDFCVHKSIVAMRRNNLGVYATVERTGLIALGDVVTRKHA